MKTWHYLALGVFLLFVAAVFVFYRPGQVAYFPENFTDSKRLLENEVYFDHRVTLYCGAEYDSDKNIIAPPGFIASSHAIRAGRMEWEHAVPAENFGRTFSEWREGAPMCVKNGHPYKGRHCAEKASAEYRRMAADPYNLFPAIGAVNAARGNRQYAELADEPAKFGSCQARSANGKFEPPDRAKGQVARASLYMADKYPRYKLSAKQRKLFYAWDKMYPVDQWECERARRIENIIGQENVFVKKPCQAAGLW